MKDRTDEYAKFGIMVHLLIEQWADGKINTAILACKIKTDVFLSLHICLN